MFQAGVLIESSTGGGGKPVAIPDRPLVGLCLPMHLNHL